MRTEDYEALQGRLLAVKLEEDHIAVCEVAAIAPGVGCTLSFVNDSAKHGKKKGVWAYCINGPLSPLTADRFKSGSLSKEPFNLAMQEVIAGIEAGYLDLVHVPDGPYKKNHCPFNQ